MLRASLRCTPALLATAALLPSHPTPTCEHVPPTPPTPSDYPYFSSWHRSYMRKYLTPTVYDCLVNLKTSNGYSLNDLISCGCATGYSIPRNMGVMTGDYECYDIFSPLLNPIINEYHQFNEHSRHVTDLDPGHLKDLDKNLDPTRQYVLSSRIRLSRSVKGVPFPAAASRADLRKVEALAENACEELSDKFKGMYVHLNDMTNEENDDLIQRHILYDNPDEWATQAGLGRNWPDARGLYVNVQDIDENPNFIMWINEEDHMRIMVMQKGGNIGKVFQQLVGGINEIENGLMKQGAEFLHDDRLGFITGCPTNLGTGMRASMHVKLMNLGNDKGFNRMCTRMGLEVRGKHGEKDKRNSGIFDISNRRRLGFSEVELIQHMMDGVRTLIEMEQKLEKGEEVDCDKEFRAL